MCRTQTRGKFMNEILQREDSAYEKGFREPEEVIRLISERMLVQRTRVE